MAPASNKWVWSRKPRTMETRSCNRASWSGRIDRRDRCWLVGFLSALLSTAVVMKAPDSSCRPGSLRNVWIRSEVQLIQIILRSRVDPNILGVKLQIIQARLVIKTSGLVFSLHRKQQSEVRTGSPRPGTFTCRPFKVNKLGRIRTEQA